MGCRIIVPLIGFIQMVHCYAIEFNYCSFFGGSQIHGLMPITFRMDIFS